MKHMIRIIRKADMQAKYKRELELEQDYLLASLHEALEVGDKVEADKIKKRLAEIHKELEQLKG